MSKDFKAGEWISADEGHPNDCEDVLVIINGSNKNIKFVSSIELATFYSDCGYILEAYPELDTFDVSYWMRIPTMPEECLAQAAAYCAELCKTAEAAL